MIACGRAPPSTKRRCDCDAICTADVTKTYGKITALHGLSVTAAPHA